MLSEKQKRFCNEYMKDLNGASACIRAGYTSRQNSAKATASRLLKNKDIEAYISELQKEIRNKWEYDLDFIVENAMKIFYRCMEPKQLKDKEGNPIIIENENGEKSIAFTFKAETALRVLEFMANLKGYGKESSQHESSIKITLTNYLQQNGTFNKYFPVTKETEHLARMLSED